MGLNAELLRASFADAVENEPRLTRRFYEILFDRYPDLERLFDPVRIERQEKMLAEALTAVLEHLDDASWLERHLGGLGAKHVDYGVTPPMYDQVGECLLMALAEACAPRWTAAIQEAWTEAYGAIRDLMLAGAESATTDERAPIAIAGRG